MSTTVIKTDDSGRRVQIIGTDGDLLKDGHISKPDWGVDVACAAILPVAYRVIPCRGTGWLDIPETEENRTGFNSAWTRADVVYRLTYACDISTLESASRRAVSVFPYRASETTTIGTGMIDGKVSVVSELPCEGDCNDDDLVSLLSCELEAVADKPVSRWDRVVSTLRNRVSVMSWSELPGVVVVAKTTHGRRLFDVRVITVTGERATPLAILRRNKDEETFGQTVVRCLALHGYWKRLVRPDVVRTVCADAVPVKREITRQLGLVDDPGTYELEGLQIHVGE